MAEFSHAFVKRIIAFAGRGNDIPPALFSGHADKLKSIPQSGDSSHKPL
jgi:hypothetical protein